MYVYLIQVGVDKWMDITNMGYVIASRYNIIIVSLSRQQSMTIFSSKKSTTTKFFCAPHDMCQSRLWKSFCSGTLKIIIVIFTIM